MPQIVYALLFLIVILFSANPASAQNSNSLTLQEGLKIVSEESRVIKIAKLSEAMAESDANMARSALLPQLAASAARTDLGHQPAMLFGGQAVPVSDSGFYSYSISIQQLLFDFRGSLSRYEAARMLVEAQKLDSTRTRNEIALEFTKSFYDLLESMHLTELAAKEIERLEAHNRDATLLYKGGVITKNDLLQVQVRLSDAREKHLSAKNLEALRVANLNNLLLRPLNGNIQPEESNEAIVAPPQTDLKNAWAIAATRRPEILIVDRTLSALDLDETVKRSEFLPKLYVRAADDYTENSYQLHENNWSLTFGITANLFDGGRSFADLQKTKSRKRQLLEQRARLVDGVKLELQNSLLQLDNSYARILVNRDAAGQAEENLRINKKRYEEGEGTATEVLDAVTLLTVAETNQIRSTYDYRKAEAAVHYAMGGDLRDIYR
jgi:outer membrane protein